jgi:hypothetical protein
MKLIFKLGGVIIRIGESVQRWAVTRIVRKKCPDLVKLVEGGRDEAE